MFLQLWAFINKDGSHWLFWQVAISFRLVVAGLVLKKPIIAYVLG